MTPELQKQISDLVYAAIPVIILFGLAIIAATFLQEFVRKWFRNGKGNRRGDAQEWPSQMLLLLGGMNQKLNSIHETLSNGLPHKIEELKDAIEKKL